MSSSPKFSFPLATAKRSLKRHFKGLFEMYFTGNLTSIFLRVGKAEVKSVAAVRQKADVMMTPKVTSKNVLYVLLTNAFRCLRVSLLHKQEILELRPKK